MSRRCRSSPNRLQVRPESLYLMAVVYVPTMTFLVYLNTLFYEVYNEDDPNDVFVRLLLGLLLVLLCLRFWLSCCSTYKSTYLVWKNWNKTKVIGIISTCTTCLLWASSMMGFVTLFPYLWDTVMDGKVPQAFYFLLDTLLLNDLARFSTMYLKAQQPQSQPSYPEERSMGVNHLGLNFVGMPQYRNIWPKVDPSEVGILPHTGWRLIPYFLTICMGLEVCLIVLEQTLRLHGSFIHYGLILALVGCFSIFFAWMSFVLVCYPKRSNKDLTSASYKIVTRGACSFAIIAEVSLLLTVLHGLVRWLYQERRHPTAPKGYIAYAVLLQYSLVLFSLVCSLTWYRIMRHKRHYPTVETVSYWKEKGPQVDGGTDAPEAVTREPFFSVVCRFGKKVTKWRISEDAAFDAAMASVGIMILSATLVYLIVEAQSGNELGPNGEDTTTQRGLYAGIGFGALFLVCVLGLLYARWRKIKRPAEKLAQLPELSQLDDRLPPGLLTPWRKADMFAWERATAYSTPASRYMSPATGGTRTPTKARDGHSKRAKVAGGETSKLGDHDSAQSASPARAVSEHQPAKGKPRVTFALDDDSRLNPIENGNQPRHEQSEEWETITEGSSNEIVCQSRRHPSNSFALDGNSDVDIVGPGRALPRILIRSVRKTIRPQQRPRIGLLPTIDEDSRGRIGADEEFEMQAIVERAF